MIYLAQPFKHEDQAIRHARYLLAVDITKNLIDNGQFVYSPIVHSYRLFEGSKGFEFWRPFDFHMVSKADEILIVQIEGTKESVGVRAETDLATALEIPLTDYWPTSDQLNDVGLNRASP